MSDAPTPKPLPEAKSVRAPKAKSTTPKSEKVKKLLLFFIHPMAIGTYLALAFSWTAYSYYIQRDQISSRSSGLIKYILDIDQKTIDWRFKLRGEREPSPSVAVLAVDDRSIDIVGRWPWPRDVLAHALDNAYKYGAKVIAADVVWSEPTDRPEVRLVDEIEKTFALPSTVKEQFTKRLSETDSDAIFGDFVTRHAKDFVVGNFFNGSTEWQERAEEGQTGLERKCVDLALADSSYKKMYDRQGANIPAKDSSEDMPGILADVYKQYFKDLGDAARKGNPVPKNRNDQYTLDQAIIRRKLDFCAHDFLQKDEKGQWRDETAEALAPNWATAKSQDPSITATSFDEWVDRFKAHNPLNAVTQTEDWTTTLPTIAEKSKTDGYFNAKLDRDGTIRRTYLTIGTGSFFMPSIALAAYLAATNQIPEINIGPHDVIPGLTGIKKLTINNDEGDPQFDVPVTPEGFLDINYDGPRYQIPHASIADLLDESSTMIHVNRLVKRHGRWEHEVDENGEPIQVPKAEFFKDKILVLGATAIGIFDLRVTPFDENYPGVETHANVIDNLLRRDFLAAAKNEGPVMPLIMLAIGLILSFALARFGAISGLFVVAIIGGAILYVDSHFLFGRGILVSSGLPLAQVFITYMFLTTYKYFTEERSKKELRGTFSKYVSPAIVEEILRDPKNLELGGRKERITVFFSDVRGFTTISEKLDPRALSDLLNSYLTPMTELVFKNKGTLDKYMGDAIMAFFGAPIHYPDHAKYACRCALQSLEKLKELHAEYQRKGLPTIDIGIGLNTGECSVGNMGSETVRSYTVMGDAVNLASRLEGINKEYGTRIIISENTYTEVKGDFLCREVDWVRVKGKLQPVKIYELISEGKGAQNVIDMAKYFAEGYQKYHEKSFDQAIAHFEKAIGITKDRAEDKTSRLYIERCQEFIEEPPPENWDGVYVMKTK